MLKVRVLTATIFLAVFLPALFLLPENAWLVFCAAALFAAAWEWASLSAPGDARGRLAYAVLLVALFLVTSMLGAPGRSHAPLWVYSAGSLFWILLAPLWMWRRPLIGGRMALLGTGALVLLPAFAAAVDLRSVHPGLLLSLLVTVWISDTSAYFTGRRFGRHKLAPAISPGKTWEGVGGALAAVTVYALAWASLAGPTGLPIWPDGTQMARPWIVAVLLALAVAGMIGDLFESLIKRQAGVKDSGTLLPGHGGILDRIDALLAMLPLAVLAFMR